MSKVFFDTNLFIYFLEDAGDRGATVARLLDRMKERGDTLCTSTLTLGEVLVKPLEAGDKSLAARYEAALTREVRLIPFDRDAARHCAQLRTQPGLRAPDAIQLACAAVERCDLFITNDERLSHRLVPGIQFVASLARAPL